MLAKAAKAALDELNRQAPDFWVQQEHMEIAARAILQVVRDEMNEGSMFQAHIDGILSEAGHD